MPNTQSGDRSATVASVIIAMLEAKTFFPDGNSLEAKSADVGRAFKTLYQAVAEAEKGA